MEPENMTGWRKKQVDDLKSWDYAYMRRDIGFSHDMGDMIAGRVRDVLAVIGVVACIFAAGVAMGVLWWNLK